MKKLTLIALVIFLFVPAASEATASPYLGPGEACRVAGRIIHSEYANVIPGSSRGHCRAIRYRINLRSVDICYRDYNGRWFYTGLNIRETWYNYRYNIWDDRRIFNLYRWGC